MLWVSLDGAGPQAYADVRLADEFAAVVANLARLRDLRAARGAAGPQLGIAFVAMRGNLAELPRLVRLGLELGARRFSVSHVLAHSAELKEEALYAHSLDQDGRSAGRPLLDLPRLELTAETAAVLGETLALGVSARLAGQPLNRPAEACPFAAKGSLSVRWDGQVSPCLALLHGHPAYLGERVRRSQAYALGSLAERGLAEIWLDAPYRALRAKLQAFDFSPCAACNACEYAAGNQEDCFSSGAPACGGCLWAQGLIRCP
jgi:MoaA/NifB/PqqE/SkfB family radical SAM enzyme